MVQQVFFGLKSHQIVSEKFLEKGLQISQANFPRLTQQIRNRPLVRVPEPSIFHSVHTYNDHPSRVVVDPMKTIERLPKSTILLSNQRKISTLTNQPKFRTTIGCLCSLFTTDAHFTEESSFNRLFVPRTLLLTHPGQQQYS